MARNPKSHPAHAKFKGALDQQLKQLSKNIEDAVDGLGTVAYSSLQKIGQELYDKSTEVCPKDTNELVNSAFLGSERTLDHMAVRVGYKADHAVFAHENAGRDVDYVNPTTPGTHWKFLEQPLTELEADVEKIIADDLKDYLR